MRLTSLLKPAAYAERFGRLRRYRRAMPPAVENRWTWLLRRLLLPQVALPMWIRTRGLGRYFLGRDPTSDALVEELFGPCFGVFFPELDGWRPATILDLGAHQGLFTVAALHRWPGSRVVAVEPEPDNFELLRKNASGNGLEARVRAVAAAISELPGVVRLSRGADSCAHHVVDEPAEGSAEAPTAEEVIDVPARTVEEILDGARPDLVKCNAEGAEYHALPWLAENCSPRLFVAQIHGTSGRAGPLVAEIESLGYDAIRVRGVDRDCFWHFRKIASGADEGAAS